MGYKKARDLQEAIQELFGVHSRAEEDYLRQIFQQTHKGSLKMVDYLWVMKSHVQNLGQAGNPVSARSLVSQVLSSLDEEYNPAVAMIQGKMRISWSEMQAELFVFEKRLELQNTQNFTTFFSQTMSMNMVSK